MCELCQLLRDGARALGERAAFQVAPDCAEDSVWIDSPVDIKPHVLRRDKGLLCVLRDFIKRYHRPVFGSAHFAHQDAVAVINRRGLSQTSEPVMIKPLPIRDVKDYIEPRSEGQNQPKKYQKGNEYPLFSFSHAQASRTGAISGFIIPDGKKTIHDHPSCKHVCPL